MSKTLKEGALIKLRGHFAKIISVKEGFYTATKWFPNVEEAQNSDVNGLRLSFQAIDMLAIKEYKKTDKAEKVISPDEAFLKIDLEKCDDAQVELLADGLVDLDVFVTTELQRTELIRIQEERVETAKADAKANAKKDADKKAKVDAKAKADAKKDADKKAGK